MVTGAGEVIALDAKMNFDDNALFRHKDVAEMRDEDEEDPMEIEAAKHELNYIVELDDVHGRHGETGAVDHAGDVAVEGDVVEVELLGAALLLVFLAGIAPVGDVLAVEGVVVDVDLGVECAQRTVGEDRQGVDLRCDMIAEGIITAVKEVGVNVPVVVRLEGTNVDQGKAMLADSGLAIISADNLADAADKAVAAAGGKN